MYCRNCGKDNLEGAQVCAGCGAQLAGTPQVLQTTQGASPKTSGLAVASLVLGILGFLTCGVTALPGLILGIIAAVKISSNRDKITGTGLAAAGIALSGIALLILPIFAAVLFPVFSKARQSARGSACVPHAKQLGASMRMYLADNNDTFPPAASWSDALKPYGLSTGSTDSAYVCPAAPNLSCGYGLNQALAGQPEAILSSGRVVLLFESDRGWNGYGGAESMITAPRHRFVTTVCADGHAIKAFPGYLNQLPWKP